VKNIQDNSKQRGYTLMEMMVVLALIAVAAALVVPSIARGYGNFELRLAATSVSTAFKQARTHAVYEARNYVVIFGPEQQRSRDIYIVRDDGKTAEHVTLSGNLRLLAGQQRGVWTEELRPIHFFPDGRSDGMQLDMAGGNGHHLQLWLNPLTARAQVTQLYDSQEQAAAPAEEPAANDVHVITGARP
jgi:general secretion pathway protein H